MCTSQVQIMDFKERSTGKDLITATIFVEQDSQKGIIVGRKAIALKALGTAARADIEDFLGDYPFPICLLRSLPASGCAAQTL